ncbi:GFA family protein [Pseudosulfitobacter pseudonitzschiae]|uniref:GFA family protein n=1 Tax=Pseudosulfitobacter pseudonitzschiae TaxID=1402135 RepID=UPI001AF73975|nr:GFA family protein [Pseudosulfitobacter pseudonitzschiae]MBM1815832.1 GFA family protein [Pseudosulfitobacter pseudonitzschiae]MBM1832823.1 GFA family protein [Pseudosulfitobacter pseudonitzschiae]MBM1837691.1 GFA family protein [Pseudosulfitobacter pseudonitzschiae]MBM1842537.1 GFA family protein [Pseudosulfitobacter pseudonitzschiae]MBM1847405.1 GFA family protein [Pseudosulfitobacter pseudonitzschiae]
MARTGSCNCGAVRYRITADVRHTGACHCGMCRKWSGGVYLGVEVAPADMNIEGLDRLTTYTSSPWAERAFCGTCGCNIFYRVTAPGPHQGTYHVGLGTMDDTSGITLTEEIFIDRKPQGYAFAGDTRKMTEAEVMAMFAPD